MSTRGAGLPELVLRAVREFGLWTAGEPVVAAVSGGADSSALLACLQELPPAWRPAVTVAHLDHGLRRESAAEAQAVLRLAARWGLPCVAGTAVVSPGRGASPEEAARRARYRFLAGVAARVGSRAVAVGHHRGDRRETVLLRLLRGAGTRGLSGIRPARPLGRCRSAGCRVVRPLWYAERDDIEAYLAARGLSWLEDPSNGDLARPRNRIRHELLPACARVLGAGAGDAILRAAENLAEDDAALAAWAAREAAGRLRGTGLDLRQGWSGLPAAIRHRLVQIWWQGATAAPPLPRRLVLQVLAEGGCDLPGGWRAVRAGGVLQLRRAGGDGGPPPEYVLPVPGRVAVPELGLLRADIAAAAPAPGAPVGACGCPVGLAFPLRVRRPLAGERVAVRGGTGRRSVRELLRAAAVPPAARALPRVVTDARGCVLWVAGARVAAGLPPPDGRGPVLCLTLAPGAVAGVSCSLC